MVGSTRGWLGFLTVVGLVAGCAGLFRSAPLLPTYAKVLTLGPRIEWRFNPLALDLNRDGHLDLVATARLVKPALHMWVGDGKATFTSIAATWTDIGYAALASGDINGDGFPDIVAASHFGVVQTLLSDGRGGFTEKTLRREDGYVAAALGDLDGDGNLDILAGGNVTGDVRNGYGLFWFRGDGKGGWRLVQESGLPTTGLPLVHSVTLADLDGDGTLEVIALSGGPNGSITVWKRQ